MDDGPYAAACIETRSATMPAISFDPSRVSEAPRPVSAASFETDTICVATSRAAIAVSSTVREISDVMALCSSIAVATTEVIDSTLRMESPIRVIDATDACVELWISAICSAISPVA